MIWQPGTLIVWLASQTRESGVTWSLNSTSNFTINSQGTQGVVTVGDVLDREVSETLFKTLF